MVKLYVPVFCGVPWRLPVLGSSVNPLGAVPPMMPHEYGGTPPVAANDWAYAVPTIPLKSGGTVVICNGAGLMVADNVAVPERLFESVARTMKEIVPLAVGVPLTTPVVAFRVK